MNFTAITPLLVRVIAFLVAFVVLSGILGPRIISSDVLNRDYFWVYGSLGKALLFAGLAFLLLARSKPLPQLYAWHPRLGIWAGASLSCLVFAWVSVGQLISQGQTWEWTIAAHGSLLASVGLALLACFGRANLRRIGSAYRLQLSLSAGGAFAFYGLLELFYASWEFFSTLVLHAVRWLLDLSGIFAAVLLPHTLLLEKFSVTVAKSCSGVESMALFTGLYAIIGLVDWRKFNLRRFFLLFPIALVGLFLFNILRVFALIIGGYYIDPEIAFSLFHTYAGMVFFIIYAVIFWAVSYGWLIKSEKKVQKKTAA